MSPIITLADYHNPQHATAIVSLMDHYAQDPMGGGIPLPASVCEQLVSELSKRDFALSMLAFVEGNAVGLINAFEGFSTFACRPLLNIHDIVVHRHHRGAGIARVMLTALEQLAAERGCCKLTLEVLSENRVAKSLYHAVGFVPYRLQEDTGNAEFWHKSL